MKRRLNLPFPAPGSDQSPANLGGGQSMVNNRLSFGTLMPRLVIGGLLGLSEMG
jgi:hypothetical protein